MSVRSFRLLFAALLVSLLASLVGCGGSGGVGPGIGILTYRTSWASTGRFAGLSQLVTIYNANGASVATKLLNAPTETRASIGPISNGTYLLTVNLYASPDASGAILGQIESELVVAGGATVETTSTQPVASVRVTPPSQSFTVQESRQFRATALSADSKYVFLSPGALQWSVNNNVATINAQGVAIGQAEGAGAVQATERDSGISGSAAITVTAFVPIKTKWTVLVYLNAANDLYNFSVPNVNQMEKVAGNPEVRFVLQWKNWKQQYTGSLFEGTRRYVLSQDTGNQIAGRIVQDMGLGVDMGLPSTLLDFVTWGKAYYPAERYALVIWNHGNGWRRSRDVEGRAVSYDDETGNAIQTWDLTQALGNNKFDIVAWDASLMQMLEVAYEIQDKAQLVVGSEESPPGEGYPYDLIFSRFRDNPDASSRELSKAFVDGMLAVQEYQTREITQSVIDTSKLQPLGEAMDRFAAELIANKDLPAVKSQVQLARQTAQSYKPGTGRTYRDLIDVCRIIDQGPGVPISVLVAAQDAANAAADAVVWEGHNSNSPGSRGIAIDFSSAGSFFNIAQDYQKLRFAGATRWDEWLQVAP